MKTTIACLVGFICIGWGLATPASAQGIQDLFARPQSPRQADDPFASEATDDVRVPRRDAPLDPSAEARAASLGVASPSDRRLSESGGSLESRRHAIAMEIRQARAVRAFEERTARLEAARWSGSSTLRPSWNPDPFTASRYPNRQTIFVPAYIYR